MTEGPFERTFRVRGYEVDVTRTTPLPVVFSFLEQLRWEWLAEPAWGLVDGVHGGSFFVVRSQIVELVERPRFMDELTVTGEMEKVGRSVVSVRHRLRCGDRELGHARVQGVWLGPDRRLARIPDAAREVGRRHAETLGPLGSLAGSPEDAVLPGADARSFLDAPRIVHRARGLELSTEPPPADAPSVHLVVRPSDCDVFDHANASSWLRWFDDARLALGHVGMPARCAVEYHAEAVAGDALTVSVWDRGDQIVGCAATRGDTLLCTGALDLRHLEGAHGAR